MRQLSSEDGIKILYLFKVSPANQMAGSAQFSLVNGILKSEFDLYNTKMGLAKFRTLIARSIKAYNQVRPHSSCDYLTPEKAHLMKEVLRKRWKKRAIKKGKKILV